MTQDELRAFFAACPSVHVQVAASGDGSPEVAWGDTFIYVRDGDGALETMPFATIVTKDYPGFDEDSKLAPGARFRLNLDVGRDEFTRLFGFAPRELDQHRGAFDFTAADRAFPHPSYGKQGWISIVNPSRASTPPVLGLLELTLARALARRAGG